MVRNLCGMQAQARHRLQHRLVPHATRGNRKRLTYLAFDVNWQEKRYKQFACRLDELCQRHRYTNTCTVHVCVCGVYYLCVSMSMSEICKWRPTSLRLLLFSLHLQFYLPPPHLTYSTHTHSHINSYCIFVLFSSEWISVCYWFNNMAPTWHWDWRDALALW